MTLQESADFPRLQKTLEDSARICKLLKFAKLGNIVKNFNRLCKVLQDFARISKNPSRIFKTLKDSDGLFKTFFDANEMNPSLTTLYRTTKYLRTARPRFSLFLHLAVCFLGLIYFLNLFLFLCEDCIFMFGFEEFH